jgi:hypothetical protein
MTAKTPVWLQILCKYNGEVTCRITRMFYEPCKDNRGRGKRGGRELVEGTDMTPMTDDVT